MPFTSDEVREIATTAATRAAERAIDAAADRIAERAGLDPDQLNDLVANAVRQTLLMLGVDAQNPIEMQKDFLHLREWRKTNADLKSKGLLTLVGLVLTGAGALLLVGLKAYFGR